MAVNKGEIGIYGVLRRDGGNNILAKTDQIQDSSTGKTQAQLNQEASVLSTRVNDINIRVEGLESKISKPINYKNILENKNALDALTGVKHGDMYQVRSAVAINGKKYPENTKFVYVSTHENGVSDGWWEPFNSITLSTGASPLLFDGNGNIVMQISTGLKLGGGGQLMVNYGFGLEYIYGKLTVSTSRGINVDQGGVHINEGEGINTNDGYLNVNYGNSLTIDDASQKLEVKLDRNSGFYIHENNGLRLGTYGCIEANGTSGLNVRVRGGLTIESGENNEAVIINKGNGLGLDSNNRLEVNISTDDSGLQFENGSLKLSTGSIRVDSTNRIKILYGDGLKIGDDYKLRLNLSSTPLYFDNSKHISIRCGSGLKVGTTGDEDNKLLINHGDSISFNDEKIDVNCGAGLVITTRGLNVIAGEGITTNNGKVGIFYDNSLTVGSSKMLSVNTEFSGGISTGRYGLRINVGSTLRIRNNNVEINPGLGISTRGGKVNVLYGDCFYVSEDNILQLALSSGPLYSNNGKLSIKCSNGLIVSTNYDLCLDYGNSLYISSNTVNVRVSTINNPDIASNLLISGETGLYISSSRLAEFIKQVMATP